MPAQCLRHAAVESCRPLKHGVYAGVLEFFHIERSDDPLKLRVPAACWGGAAAPFSRHAPVDGLQAAETREDAGCGFALTSFLAEVQHTRSLTVSNVFPVGGESGTQAESPRRSQDRSEEGEARVNSDPLVEANGKLLKAR